MPNPPTTRPTTRLLTREALIRFLSRANSPTNTNSRTEGSQGGQGGQGGQTGQGGQGGQRGSPQVAGDAYLYGAEFQGGEPQFRKDNLMADTFEDQDVVCAVCRSKVRLSKVSCIIDSQSKVS